MTLADLVHRHAVSADDEAMLRQCLGLDPTPSRRPVQQPRIVPAHDVHDRAHYTPGCRQCAARNSAYMRRWRLAGRAVTPARVFARLVRVPQPLRPDSRRRACSEQLSMEVSA